MRVFFLVAIIFFLGIQSGSGSEEPTPVLTHADAAVLLAKYSGFFDYHVAEDADLNECVAFMNKIGVYFGLMEVVNGSEFSKKDCAKAMGQIELILNGEAEYSAGKVKLPKGLESWADYCTMNGVEYVEAYRTMLEMLRMAYEQSE